MYQQRFAHEEFLTSVYQQRFVHEVFLTSVYHQRFVHEDFLLVCINRGLFIKVSH